MDLVFESSEKKLKKEREGRRKKALEKRKKLQKQIEEAKKEEEKIQQIRIKRKEEEEREREVRIEEEREEYRLTGGVSYRVSLEGYLVEGDEKDDRVLLPPSALSTLSQSG